MMEPKDTEWERLALLYFRTYLRSFGAHENILSGLVIQDILAKAGWGNKKAKVQTMEKGGSYSFVCMTSD